MSLLGLDVLFISDISKTISLYLYLELSELFFSFLSILT